MTKKQNRLQDSKGVMYVQPSENLRHIMHAKKLVGKNVYDSLSTFFCVRLECDCNKL